MADPSSSLIARLSSSPARSATAAALTTLAILAIAAGIHRAHKEVKLRTLKSSIPHSSEDTGKLTEYGIASHVSDEDSIRLAGRARRGDYDEEIILEQLSRNRIFLGDDGLAKIRKAFIIVVGCGGVGSWAATMLVRSGVARIRFIDFDQVTLSSLNRHAVATLDDVGTPKVQCMKKALLKIAPWTEIDARNELWTMDVAGRLLEGHPTFVVDAIDNIDTKVDLLYYCHSNNIPVISSMGAGCKSDPTRICIGDISESAEDPLSRSTRRRLRAKGVSSGITTVFSTEKPGPGKASLQPLSLPNPDDPNNPTPDHHPSDLAVLPDFRIRILPVLGTMPAMFGLCLANHILCTLADYPTNYVSPLLSNTQNRQKLYSELLSSLAGLESRLRGKAPGIRVPLTENDVGYILEEVFRGKSVVSGFATRLALCRWDPIPGEGKTENDYPLKVEEVVVLTKDEAKKHEELVLMGGKAAEEVWGTEACRRVESRRREERLFSVYR